MGENLRIFKLLMHKNFVVRKKHWKMVLFLEIMVPIMLFCLGELGRYLISTDPIPIDHNTYYEPESQNQMPVSREDFEIRYAPNNSYTNEIMRRTQECMGIQADQLIGSPNEDVMLGEFARDRSDPTKIRLQCIGIVFPNLENDRLPKDLKYKVRVSGLLPTKLYDERENGYGALKTFFSVPMFPKTQICLEESYIKKVAPQLTNITMSVEQMPYPPYTIFSAEAREADKFFAELARLAFLIILCVEVTFPSNEKHIGINILMSVNGVKNRQNLLSWLVSGTIFTISYLGPCVLLLKYFYSPLVKPYLDHGSGFIVWLVLTIHGCHVIAFGMHITAYLWKPSHGVFAAFMITVILNNLNTFIQGAGLRRFLIYLGIFSPNFLLQRIFDEINAYEDKLVGVGFSNMFTVGSSGAPVEASIGFLIIFSVIGIVLHFLMALYVYEVRPGKYGVPQNPLFCLQKGNRVFHDKMKETTMDYNIENPREFEIVAEGSLIPGIQIRELKKSYTTDWFGHGTVQALKGINVDFYKGQITALLGHNGAGKTTMMSILTGLTDSTEGMVFIDGKNVQHELDVIRGNIGLCPQENMVFPDLKVFEQVLFFGMLKGKDKSKSELEEEVNFLLQKVNLTDKKNAVAKELSGGQKRRMCLAMAVIGNASVLILDEPTSGMDAESKREVWDIILKLRGEKTILISTHDMEEADILGDRIAIIHSGKMRSYGTSMFLKKLYGDGQVEVTLSCDQTCDPYRIIQEIGVNAQLLSKSDGQAVLAIPQADNLPDALDKLESQKTKFGVTGLSVSVITLEQIFLKVTRENGDEADLASQPAKSFEKITGLPYFAQTCYAYVVKKLAFTRKNPWTMLITMLLPCVSAGLLVLLHEGIPTLPDPIDFSLNAYSRTKALSWSNEPIYSEKYEKSAKDFGGTSESIKSGFNMTESLIEVALDDLSAYRNRYIVSGEITATQESISAKGFFSGTAYVGIPATINMLSNAIIKSVTGDDAYKISLTAQQLPPIVSSSNADMGTAFALTMALIVFLAPAVALYSTQPLQENLSGVKQLQFMSGASSLSYWISTFLFDLLQFTISTILLISLFVIVDAVLGTNYYRGEEIMIFFLLMIMFGLSVLPFVYIFTFWKKTTNTTTNLLSITPLILSFVDFLLWALVMPINSKVYDHFREVQSRVFLLFPYISLTYGHVVFFDVVARNGRCRSMTNGELIIASAIQDECSELNCHDGSCERQLSYFAENVWFGHMSTYLLWMGGSIFVWFAIIFTLEQNLWFKLWSRLHRAPLTVNNSAMDELVKKEEDVVTSEVAKWMLKDGSNQSLEVENLFLAHGLSKWYGNLQVVKGISFRVKQGECFGLLGVNGAGKSTTFRMLTGAEIPNSGSMFLKDYNITTHRRKYLSEMGYCPQQDAMIDTLNAYDHLYLFARLRGMPGNEVKAAVNKWIEKLNLKRCAAQPSGTYSGGNKRRLNIAMALIGNPSLVLMDEPTTGVDPAARRSLWNTLKTCQEGGQSIILTSHSMEECEVLCNRLVIMVKGQLVCVGASQELKQRFGAGYNIHIKMNPGSDRTDVDRIKRRIETTLVCTLTDENTGFIGYHVTDPEATWTIMYTMMNDLKNDYSCIEDFAVLSSTLEQLFIQFARAPTDTDESDGGLRERRRWWQKRTNGSPV